MTAPATTGDLDGRVAIVTGAAHGIGLAAARRFLQAGASVVLADLDPAHGADIAAKLGSDDTKVRFVATDVTQEDDVQALVAHAVDAFGGVDVVFNNAGVRGVDALTADLPAAEFARVIAVNLTGVFLVMKHGLKAMLERGGGAIVNNASVLGLVGFKQQAAYTAAKGGVVQLTRTAAIEYAARGIRVNCICPGFVAAGLADPGQAARLNAMAKIRVPMARLGTLEEIAEVALFLASDRASFMTGAVIAADGGLLAG